MQMALMQQQLDALNQDKNVRNQKTTTAPSRSSTRRSEGSGGCRKVRKDNERESSNTNIPALEDAQLIQKVEQVIQKAKTEPRKEGEWVMEVMSPFISRIMQTEIPSKLKLPQLFEYDSTGDPITHISSFQTKMMLQNVPSMLTKIAQRWFHQLPQNSVPSFDELA